MAKCLKPATERIGVCVPDVWIAPEGVNSESSELGVWMEIVLGSETAFEAVLFAGDQS